LVVVNDYVIISWVTHDLQLVLFPFLTPAFAQVLMYYGMQELPHEVGLQQHTRLTVLSNVWSFWATQNATTL